MAIVGSAHILGKIFASPHESLCPLNEWMKS